MCLEETPESKNIEEDGVLCSVHREELLDDKEALLALMSADDDDARTLVAPSFDQHVQCCVPARMPIGAVVGYQRSEGIETEQFPP